MCAGLRSTAFGEFRLAELPAEARPHRVPTSLLVSSLSLSPTNPPSGQIRYLYRCIEIGYARPELHSPSDGRCRPSRKECAINRQHRSRYRCAQNKKRQHAQPSLPTPCANATQNSRRWPYTKLVPCVLFRGFRCIRLARATQLHRAEHTCLQTATGAQNPRGKFCASTQFPGLETAIAKVSRHPFVNRPRLPAAGWPNSVSAHALRIRLCSVRILGKHGAGS